MKILLLLNGPENFQMGIEDGFNSLKDIGKVTELNWFYYEHYSNLNGANKTIEAINDLAEKLKPEMIVFFHVLKFPITKGFIKKLRSIESKPIVIYDEGDMYGGFTKPITSSMKVLMQESDVVSIRGLGKFYNKVKQYNKNVIYTPHSNSLYRYTNKLNISKNRNYNVVFIGNNIRSKLGYLRRIPGSVERENFVKNFGKCIGDNLNVYGRGWDNIVRNEGYLDFKLQHEVCNQSWFHVSYEHYPNIPYYFSDRLPIVLASGQIYICHYHKGYENIFAGCDFMYFFKTQEEAIDIIKYLSSLSEEQLYQKAKNAKSFSDNHLSPVIVWGNFIEGVRNLI